MLACNDCGKAEANHVLLVPPREPYPMPTLDKQGPIGGNDWRTVAVHYRGDIYAYCDEHIDAHYDEDSEAPATVDGQELGWCVLFSALSMIRVMSAEVLP